MNITLLNLNLQIFGAIFKLRQMSQFLCSTIAGMAFIQTSSIVKEDGMRTIPLLRDFKRRNCNMRAKITLLFNARKMRHLLLAGYEGVPSSP